MTLPKEFERVKSLRRQVQCAELAATKAREGAQRVTQLLNGLPHAKGSSTSRLDCCMVQALDLEARAAELKCDLALAEMEATGLILSHVDDEIIATVMYLRYVEGASLNQIHEQLWYSRRTIYRQCARGLKLLQS